MPVQIEASDVIRLVLQFLRENGLHETLQKLQEESGVAMNSLSDPSHLVNAIQEGRWDAVLRILSTIKLPQSQLYDVYELLIVELVAQGDLDTARLILRRSTITQTLREENEKRYLRLENFISQASFGTSLEVESYFKGVSASVRRERVAQRLGQELMTAPNGRLLTLIGQAIEMQVQSDQLPAEAVFDIFHGVIPKGSAVVGAVDMPVSTCFQSREFISGAHVESSAISPNGTWLAVGLADGFIEILNSVTGQRRLDLPYQQNESSMMVMENPVISMSFNSDGSVLAVGTFNGDAALWRTDTGTCLARFPSLHKELLSVIKISRDGQTILTAGYDGIVKLTGIRSSRTVKEFNQHSSFVTDATFNHDETLVYSCGSDGKLNIFDIRRGSCVKTITPFSSDALSHGSIQKIILCTVGDGFYLFSKSGRVLLLSPDGKTRQEICSVVPKGHDDNVSMSQNDIISAVASPRQKYLYLIHEKDFITCIDSNSGLVISEIKTFLAENIGCISHPLYNQLISYNADGKLQFWKPA